MEPSVFFGFSAGLLIMHSSGYHSGRTAIGNRLKANLRAAAFMAAIDGIDSSANYRWVASSKKFRSKQKWQEMFRKWFNNFRAQQRTEPSKPSKAAMHAADRVQFLKNEGSPLFRNFEAQARPGSPVMKAIRHGILVSVLIAGGYSRLASDAAVSGEPEMVATTDAARPPDNSTASLGVTGIGGLHTDRPPPHPGSRVGPPHLRPPARTGRRPLGLAPPQQPVSSATQDTAETEASLEKKLTVFDHSKETWRISDVPEAHPLEEMSLADLIPRLKQEHNYRLVLQATSGDVLLDTWREGSGADEQGWVGLKWSNNHHQLSRKMLLHFVSVLTGAQDGILGAHGKVQVRALGVDGVAESDAPTRVDLSSSEWVVIEAGEVELFIELANSEDGPDREIALTLPRHTVDKANVVFSTFLEVFKRTSDSLMSAQDQAAVRQILEAVGT